MKRGLEQKVGELSQGKNLYVARIGQTVLDVVRLMAEKRIGAVPVLEENRLVGIFSERDLLTRVVVRELDAKATRVEEVMTRNLVVADKDESCESCLRKMKQIGIRHLPIVSGGKLVGIVSMRDLLLFEASAKEEEIKWLRAYIDDVLPIYEEYGGGD